MINISSISDEVGRNTKETAKEVTKAAALISIVTTKEIYHQIKVKYKESKNKLAAGENNIDKLINSKASLKQLEINKAEIKDIDKVFRDNGVPYAIVKSEDKAKFIFFENHIDLVNKSMENYLENKELNTEIIPVKEIPLFEELEK